ncbi:MMPL family transporter [Vibrio sp. V39_P1S14PM300]|uniref:MMPL family transporter n=1 Tax=Vibrio sp. V39_P1S14PM300 TaxID=1938690 RepID=UPI00137279D8|nr:MMPL family transporter [Vibrio sp. V39_P1S14PM300]NAX20286.1 MMPL family transporter [Vibrio sp. V39_P1S14PM300]
MPSKPSLISDSGLGGRRIAVWWLILVTLCLALLTKQWAFSAQAPIETDILKLLPKNQQNPLAEQAFDNVTTSLSDKVVFVLTGTEDASVYQAADTLGARLKQSGYFATITARIDADQQAQWASYYFQHRFQQLTEEQRQRLTQSPQAQLTKVIQSLYNPFSGVTSEELKNDPFLLFRDYLNQLTAGSSQFKFHDGFLTTRQEGQLYVLVSAELRQSPYSMAAQQAVPEIEQIEALLRQDYQVDTLHSGVLFYASFGTQSAKSEISTIGLYSLLGIVLLIALVFRSLTPLSLALLSISVGLVVAMAVTTWLFGKIHLFSLVFGASLIGVSIDYAFHYLTDRLAAGPKWNSITGLKHIMAAITFGLLTSLIGYLGLLVAPFPGLQQLALFSAIGLSAAYMTVVAWYPWLAAKPMSARALPAQSVWQWWLGLWSKPALKYGLPLTVLGVSALALTQVRYNDDIRQLQAMPDSLKQQETRIADITGLKASQQMLVVSADNDESLMQALESLDPQLQQWQTQHILGGYQSLSQYLGSRSRQQQDHHLIARLYTDYAPQLAKQLKWSDTPSLPAGFRAVSLQQYLSQPVADPLRFLYLGQIDGQAAAVVMLRGVCDASVIRIYAENSAGLTYLDKAEDISALFAQYRVKVMELLIAAVAVIALLLLKRYGWTHTIQILLPCLIACLAGLAVTTLSGSALNLFNLLALILIVGIGIDYTLFFAEQSRSHATLLAITLSAVTTLLSFGLLALSQTHAIHSFGITVLSGIFVAWLLSPLAIRANKENS